MRAADRIECGVDASASLAPRSDPAHGRNEVTSAVVDRHCAETFNRGHVRGRAGPDRLKAEVTRKVEQSCADRSRGADDEDRCAPR